MNKIHDFDIKQGFNNITILFCRRCGLSYSLLSYNGKNSCAWVEMPFVNGDDEPVSPPALPCENGCAVLSDNEEASE